MHKSSIHFRQALGTSEAHNLRQVKLDYNVEDLMVNNESFVVDTIADRMKQVQVHCKKVSGRKLQKNAQVIREAVVNLKPNTSMEDLKELSRQLQSQYGINCFQIHIHRDEGHKDPETGKFKVNDHAHMLFDWQDKAKGTVIKLNRVQMSQIQTLVANVLEMERGELRVNSNRERLEPVEFKKQQAELQLQVLQEKNKQLEMDINLIEQKKNEVRARIAELDQRGAKEALSDTISELVYDPSVDQERIFSADENDLSAAISILEKEIHGIETQIRS